MEGYGKVVSYRRLEDGLVEGSREHIAGTRRQRNLYYPGIMPHPVYLPCSSLGILGRHRHRAAQPVIPREPVLQQPVVVGGSQGRRELGLHSHVRWLDGTNEDRVLDVVRVEELVAHNLVTRAGGRPLTDHRLGHRKTGYLRIGVGEPVDARKSVGYLYTATPRLVQIWE